MVSSAKNGIGTFLKSLVSCFSGGEFQINILCFNAVDDEFVVQQKDGIKNLLFPKFKQGCFVDNGQSITRVMFRYIKDSADNVFILNHLPCVSLLTCLKEYYPQSKRIFVIHDLSWTSMCLGDCAMLNMKITEQDKQLVPYVEKEKETFELVDKVICLSSNTYNLLTTTYEIHAEKIRLITNGLQQLEIITDNSKKESVRADFNIGQNEILLLYVGRATKSKGFFPLIKAFEKLVQSNNNVRLVVAGSSYVEAEIPSNVSTRITFLGHIEKEELTQWYAISDIGVIPSYSEQCSYVGIEMLMYGLPIVASNGFGLTDMFNTSNSYVAEIVSRDNEEIFVQNLLNGMLALINSSDLRQQLSDNARKTFLDRYSIPKMCSSYLDCINSLYQ